MNNEIVNNLQREKAELGLAPKELGKNQVALGDEAGYTNGVPNSLVKAVIKQESGGNPAIVSKAGAIGLMQLMPDTAKELGVDPWDANQNIQGGTKYLKQQFDKYQDWEKALAAYNAGPDTVDKAIAMGGDWKANMAKIQSPENFLQTKQYVENLSKFSNSAVSDLIKEKQKLFGDQTDRIYDASVLPDPTKGIADENTDWVEQGALNTKWDNIKNSFLQGIDQTQQSSDFNLQDDAQRILDEYPDKKSDLDYKLQSGTIDQNTYMQELQELNNLAQTASANVQKYQKDIDSNTAEIKNEPVSKKYQIKNWLVQGQGSQADLWDKLTYSYPQVWGSSASLMGQSIAGTFGGKVFQNLAAAALGALAPEPVASKVAAGVALTTALGLITNSRRIESNSEVGDAIKQNQQTLLENWQKYHPGQEPSEEDLRRIRMQARVGKDQLFNENMALAIPDIVEALIMPGNKLGDLITGLSKPLKGLERGIETFTDASKLTRNISRFGRLYTNYLKEKGEEGFQYAASQRQQDHALNLGLYENQGLISSILTDAYDTMSSINYSPIGIVRNEDGRYSHDPNFQFSEESGGMLSLLGGGAVSIPIGIYKDLRAYSKYTKELTGTPFDHADDKLLRLKTEVLQKAFDTDTVHHLIEGLKSVSQQKDINGNPLLSEEDLQKEISNIKTAYHKYAAVNDYIDTLGGFFDSKESKIAKRIAKQDLFNTIIGLTKANTEEKDLQDQKTKLRLNSKDQDTFNYRDLEHQIKFKEMSIAFLENEIKNSPEKALIYDYKKQIEILKEQLKPLKETFKTLEEPKNIIEEAPIELFKINQDLIPVQARKQLHQDNYNKLLKLKNLDDYKKHSEEKLKESEAKQKALDELNNKIKAESTKDEVKQEAAVNKEKLDAEGEDDYEKIMGELITRESNTQAIKAVADTVKAKIEEHKNQINQNAKSVEILQAQLDSNLDSLNSKIDRALKSINYYQTKLQENGNNSKDIRNLKNAREKYKNLISQAKELQDQITDLKETIKTLTVIKQDLENRLQYYNSLLNDPSLKTLTLSELKDKKAKIEKKLSSIEKIISNIKQLLEKSIAYLKEITKVILERFNLLERFKKENKFKPDTDKLRELLNYDKSGIINKPGKERLVNYATLQKQHDLLEEEILNALEHGEISEQALEAQQERLLELQEVRSKYDRQLRYLTDLIKILIDGNKLTEIPKVEKKQPAAQILQQQPTTQFTGKTIQKVDRFGILADPAEVEVVSQTRLPDGSIDYITKTGEVLNTKDGWNETNKINPSNRTIEGLFGVNHFNAIHRYNLKREQEQLEDMMTSERGKAEGATKESLLQKHGPKAFPAHFADELLSKILGTVPMSEYKKYIKLKATKVKPTKFGNVVPLGKQVRLRGKRKEGVHIILEITDPQDSKNVYALSHGYNPDFYEYLDEHNNWKPVVFTDMHIDLFKQLFKFNNQEITPETYKEFQDNWKRAKEFNDAAVIYVEQHGDKSALPDNTYNLTPKAEFDWIGNGTPISATKFPEFQNRAVIYKLAGKEYYVNGITPETAPDGLESGSYYVEAKFPNGKILWVRLFPDTVDLKSAEAQESIDALNTVVTDAHNLPTNVDLETLRPQLNEMLRKLDFFVKSSNSKFNITFRVAKASNEENYSLKVVLVLDEGRGRDNPRQEVKVRNTFTNFADFKKFLSGLHLTVGDTKVYVGDVTLRKNLPLDTDEKKVTNPLKQLASSTKQGIVKKWGAEFTFYPENFEFKDQPVVVTPVNTIEAKKADIEIGKVGNTEYEVKVDGVYYQGKKLNNPENKTHRQLIEADIERRRQEELDSIDILPANGEDLHYDQIVSNNGSWDTQHIVDASKKSFTRATGIGTSEVVKTYPSNDDYIKEHIIPEIKAKYDAELAALNPQTEAQIKEVNDFFGVSDVVEPEGIDEILANAAPNVPAQPVTFTPEQEEMYKRLLAAGISEEDARRTALETGTGTTTSDKVINLVDVSNPFTVQQAREFVQDKFGDAFTVQDINTLVSNAIINGTRVGTVLGKALYIANGVSRTYTYHEAFHALFNNLLSPRKQFLYRNKIKSELNYTPSQLAKAIEDLRSTSSQYDKLSDKEMETRVYEEALADKYADWQNKQKEVKSVWRILFEKIRNFINTILGNQSIIHLFNRIDSGAFKNSSFKDTRTGEYYKIIKNTSPSESNHIIYTIAAGVLNSQFNKSETGSRILNAFNAYAAAYDLTLPHNIEFIKSRVNVSEDLLAMKKFHNKLVQNKDLILSEVTKFLKQQGYQENVQDFDSFTDDDSELNFDAMSSEYDPSIRVGAQIKKLLATTLYKDFDMFGREVQTALPWREVYNRMLPTLSIASTSPSDIMSTMKAMSAYNKQIHAFYNRIVQLSGYDQDTDGVGVNGKNILTQLKKAFELNKILYMQARDNGDKYELFIENKRDLNETTYGKWKDSYLKIYNKIVGDVKLKDKSLLSLLQNDFVMLEKFLKGQTEFTESDKKWLYFNESLENKVFKVFNNIGINLEKEYLKFSFSNNPEDIQNRDILKDRNIKIIGVKDLEFIRQNLDKNVFERQEGLLTDIANANANFDPYAFQKTYTDAEGKKRYSYGLDSLLGVQTRKFKEIFKDVESTKKFIEANKAYWELNPLLSKDPALIVNIMNNFETGLAYDLKLDDRGVTARRINTYDALIYMHALFQNQSSQKYNGIQSAPVVLNQYADKSQQMWGVLPVFKYYDSVTKSFTEQGKTDLWNLFKQEYNRINGVYGNDFLANNNKEKKPVWIHFAMFNNTADTEAMSVLAGAKVDLESVKDRVLDLIKIAVDNEVKDHLQLLTENKLETKINKDIIKLYGDLNGYLYNFTLNNTLTTIGINQLISGDYANAKNFDDYIKRVSMVNAAGFSYARDNNPTDMHQVVFVKGSVAYINRDTKEKSYDPQYKDVEGWDEIKTDDAQVYSGLDSYVDDLARQGRLNDKIIDVVNKLQGNVIENGFPVWPTLDEIKEAGVDLIPSKQVVAGFDADGRPVFNKMAVCYITPQLCAKYVNGKFVPLEGKEELFKKWELLKHTKDRKITHIVPQTAAKLFFPDNALNLKDSIHKNEITVSKDQIHNIPNIYRRLQQENDSKEAGKITASNQIENILGSEIKDPATRELLDEHNRINSQMRTQVFNFVQSVLIQNGERGDMEVLLRKFRSIVEESTPDNQMLEMLEAEGKKMKYDSNLAHLHTKFVDLFLSTYKEVFRQKVPGVKFTAMSSEGYNIKDPKTGQYRPLQGMLHKEGTTIPAEVVVSRKWADERGFKKGDQIILFRVPSQSYHSIATAKIVELLPDAYGDTIIAPSDFVWLMGMDFDVDALYAYKKAYFKDSTGKVIEYGKESTPEEKFDGYIKDLKANNTYVKAEYNELLQNDPEYRKLNISFGDDIINEEDELYFKKILVHPTYLEDELKRIRSRVLMQVLNKFNLPNTPEKLIQSGLDAKQALTNKLFDLKWKILNSPELKQAFSEPLAEKSDESIKLGKENDVEHTRINGSPLSILNARQAAVQSKGLVGTTVNGSSFVQFVTQLGLNVSEDYQLYFNGNTYDSFASTEDTRSKFDKISMTLGSIIDGMKKPFAKFLNYDFNTVNKVMLMFGLNIPEKTIDRYFIQPSIKTITKELGKTQRLTNPALPYTKGTEKEEIIVNTEIARVKKALEKAKLPTDLNITDAEMDAALKAEQQKLYTPEYYTTQYKALKLYERLMTLDKTRAHVNRILSTNRSLGTDIEDFHKILEAEKALRPKTSEPEPIPGMLSKIVQNPVLNQNITYVKDALDALTHYDISETKLAKKIFDAFVFSFGKNLSSDDRTEIKRIIIASLQLSTLRTRENTQKFSSLLLKGNNSLSSKLLNYLQENPNNYLLRVLRFEDDAKSGYSKVTMDSRTKFTETTQDNLLNSGGRIAEKNPELYQDMFNYLVFKDSLMFKNGSFVKYMLPEMFLGLAKASQEVNRLLTEDKVNEEAFKQLVGMNTREFIDMTIENYIRHSINKNKLKSRTADYYQGTSLDRTTITFTKSTKNAQDEINSPFIDENGDLKMPKWIKLEGVLLKKVKWDKNSAKYEIKTPYGSSERQPYALTPAQNEAFDKAHKDIVAKQEALKEQENIPPTIWDADMAEAQREFEKAEVKPQAKASSIQGINISTRSTDPLGKRLTNPNWQAKDLMDVESLYKANASKIKAPHLNTEEALKYDMNLMYKLQVQKLRKNPELINEINERGGLQFLLASEHTVGVKNSRWEGKGINSNFIKVLVESYTTVAKELGKFKDDIQAKASPTIREYTPENITSLKPNEVFVFGANTAGGHGGGTAGLAQRGTTSSNYTALPVGTKGKWSEYGIVDKLMQGTEGKSFGIVTKAASISGTKLSIGSKRSVSLDRIEQSINALIQEANNHPELKFLVTKFGTNMAGFSEQEMKSLLENKNLPNNIILPKEFEVRDKQASPIVELSEDFVPEIPSMTLKDGKSYSYDQINSKLLEGMGYSVEEIGKILKRIC